MDSARVAVAALGVLAIAVSGCGFRLQGAATLPDAVAAVYLDTANRHTGFHASLGRALAARGIEQVESPVEAGSVLRILEDTSGRRVLSVSTRNTPQEYEAFYTVGFSLESGGTTLIDNEFLVATRSYSYDAASVLAMAAEERLLHEALADDLARRVLRLIERVEPARASL